MQRLAVWQKFTGFSATFKMVTERSSQTVTNLYRIAECHVRDNSIGPTYVQCYRLFTKLCLLVPQNVSANTYAIIRGYYYKLHKMCVR
jgi:hypothetical protein